MDDKDLECHDRESRLRHTCQVGRRQIRKPALGTSLVVQWLGRSPGEGIGYPLQYSWTSLVAQTVKNPPAMRETWVPSVGWEDPLEEGMATHSSNLAWRIPWTEKPGGLQSMGSQQVGRD